MPSAALCVRQLRSASRAACRALALLPSQAGMSKRDVGAARTLSLQLRCVPLAHSAAAAAGILQRILQGRIDKEAAFVVISTRLPPSL